MSRTTLTLARWGRAVEPGDRATVSLAEVAKECGVTVDTGDATLEIQDAPAVSADPGRLRHFFENLFRNAVEHGGPGVSVRVGGLAEDAGFYVEDDGPGIPESDRDDVIEPGYSTDVNGTGFGLAIVKRVAEPHGWSLETTDGTDGGARFEVRFDDGG